MKSSAAASAGPADLPPAVAAGRAESLLDPGTLVSFQDRAYSPLKQLLLGLLLAAWLLVGMIGHSPWKPSETTAVQVVEESYARDWKGSGPTLLDEPYAGSFLYLQVAGIARRVLSPPLARHDAMRLPNILWAALALFGAGLAAAAGRGNNRFGWRAALLLAGCVGLLVPVRTLNPDIILLVSSAWLCLGLWLLPARPAAAGALILGCALLGLLAAGWHAFLQVLLALPLARALVAPAMQGSRSLLAMAPTIALAAALLVGWLFDPQLLNLDVSAGAAAATGQSAWLVILGGAWQLLKNGMWVGWLAVPLLLLVAVVAGRKLLADRAGAAAAAVFVAGCVSYVIATDHSETAVFMLLPAAAVIAAVCFANVPQELARCFEYYAVFLLGFLFIGGSWFMLLSLHGGWPQPAVDWLAGFGIAATDDISAGAIFIAVLATVGYLFSLLKMGKSFDRLAVNWGVGLIMSWLVMSQLWLPAVDRVRDYSTMAAQISARLPADECVARASRQPSDAIVQLAYFTGRTFPHVASAAGEKCQWLVAAPESRQGKAVVTAGRHGREDELALYRM